MAYNLDQLSRDGEDDRHGSRRSSHGQRVSSYIRYMRILRGALAHAIDNYRIDYK